MSAEPKLALKVAVALVLLVAVFLAGAWWGAQDRTCVTMDGYVECRAGLNWSTGNPVR